MITKIIKINPSDLAKVELFLQANNISYQISAEIIDYKRIREIIQEEVPSADEIAEIVDSAVDSGVDSLESSLSALEDRLSD